MFLMHASDKVTTLNAYVSGFGASKRVVVWDTSIAKGTPGEILFIFGHEMGHYVLGHIVSSILFSFVIILVSFFLGFHFFQFLLRRYGDRWRVHSQDNWAALVVFVLVLSVIGFLTEPIDNTFSRMHEHAADVYGEEAMHGIVPEPAGHRPAGLRPARLQLLRRPRPQPLRRLLDLLPPLDRLPRRLRPRLQPLGSRHPTRLLPQVMFQPILASTSSLSLFVLARPATTLGAPHPGSPANELVRWGGVSLLRCGFVPA